MKKVMRGDRRPFIVMMICTSQFGSCGKPGYDQRYFKSKGLSSKCHFSLYSLLFCKHMKLNFALKRTLQNCLYLKAFAEKRSHID